MYICITIFKMRANICTYFKNADQLASSAQNIDILIGSPRSDSLLPFALLFGAVADMFQCKWQCRSLSLFP